MDGISAIVNLFNDCLKKRIFPSVWKIAVLVLIPKGWPLDVERPKLRPICLLSNTGKLLETVLVNRLHDWMRENPMAQLSESQYGFRRGMSTNDALLRVCSTINRVREQGGVTVVVSIDIVNAFNTIPWAAIVSVLSRKGFPVYLRDIIEDYLKFRSVEYLDGEGRWVRREVCE